jgi:hypothetical protein
MYTSHCRSSFIVAVMLATAPVSALAVELESIDRTIVREPKYEALPAYCLLVFGAEGSTRVWLVEDGKRLYVDRNANGDLTDDGEPVAATEEREFETTDINTSKTTTLHDWDYAAGGIKLPNGEDHTDLEVIRWQYGKQPVQHGVLLKINGKVPVYSGWGHVFAESAAKAPIMHFGGDYNVTPLRNKSLNPAKPPSRFSIGFVSPGLGDSSSTRISIDALPKEVIPQCEIDWPSKDKPGETFTTTIPLTERCCYWEFYTEKFQIPDEAGEGTAHVRVSVPGLIPFRFAKREFDIPVTRTANNAVE